MGPFKRLKPTLSVLLIAVFLCYSNAEPPNSKEDDDLLATDEDVGASDGDFPKLDDYEIEYKTPVPSEEVHFYETFDDVEVAKKRWIVSRAQKEDKENVFKYEGRWEYDLPERKIFPNDFALVLKSKATHSAIAAKLPRSFEFTKKPFIVQYEVTFQNGMDCGGAYIKLLSDSKDFTLEEFHDKSPYTIMFGPDKCGSDIKLHFIFRHKHPLNGTYEEKHAKRPSNRMEESFTDKKPHLYRLVLRPDNKFEVYVDGLLINQGSLLEDMEPPVNPPIEIEDPDDQKPDDWDEREKIPDENTAKPDDWDDEAPPKVPDPNGKVPDGWLEDEPEMIPDPTAKMPEDWDESMDGTWEAPLIPNPKCDEAAGCGAWTAPLVENPNFRGKWQPPTVANPNFKGKWARRKIPNPNYFEDKEPFKMTPIGAVGLEIWTMTDGVLFDNFIVSDNEAAVNDFTENTFTLKSRALERDSRGVIERIINYSNSQPWLYAVYLVVFGLPIVLLLAYCCGWGDRRGDPAAARLQEEAVDDVEEENENEVQHHDGSGDAHASDGVDDARPKREPRLRTKHTINHAAAAATNNQAEFRRYGNLGMSKDELEQPQEEPTEQEQDEDEEDEIEEVQQEAQASVTQAKTSQVEVAQYQQDSDDDDELIEDDEAALISDQQNTNGDVDADEDEVDSDDEAPSEEVIDEVIPETEEHSSNEISAAGLKKRRVRRD